MHRVIMYAAVLMCSSCIQEKVTLTCHYVPHIGKG